MFVEESMPPKEERQHTYPQKKASFEALYYLPATPPMSSHAFSDIETKPCPLHDA